MEAGNVFTINVLVMQGKPLDFDLLLCIDTIKVLSSICITQYGSVKFEETQPVCKVICISEADFSAKFEQQGVWVTAWKWSAGYAPEKLWNRISEYPVSSNLREEYKQELQTWMDNGWLLPYIDEDIGPPKGLMLLMVVLQTNKHKVHPVVDYHELNSYVDTFTSAVDVCAENLWECIHSGPQKNIPTGSCWEVSVAIPESMLQGKAILSD